jgi:hypothetical protein
MLTQCMPGTFWNEPSHRLKNTAHTLPLTAGQKVVVLGPTGVSGYSLLSDYFGDQVCYLGGYDCILTLGQGIAAANSGGETQCVRARGVVGGSLSSICVYLA